MILNRYLSINCDKYLINSLIIIFFYFKCGFFKRFDPQEIERQINESSISDEELSNDVIDVSKESNKVDSNRENINLIASKQKINKNIDKSKPGNVINNTEAVLKFSQLNPSFTTNNWSSPKLEIKLSNRNFDLNVIPSNDELSNSYPNSQSNTSPIQFTTFQSISKLNNSPTTFSPASEKKILLVNQLSMAKSETNLESRDIETLKTRQNNVLKSPKLNHDNIYTNKLPPVPKRNSKNTISVSNSSTNLNFNQPKLINNLNGYKSGLNLSSNLVETNQNLDNNQKLIIELNSRNNNFNRSNSDLNKDVASLVTAMQIANKMNNNFYHKM